MNTVVYVSLWVHIWESEFCLLVIAWILILALLYVTV
jgi:hypothetical protein